MKKYNRPIVEIKGFEVQDIIAISTYFDGDAELQAVYADFVGGSATGDEEAIVFEW